MSVEVASHPSILSSQPRFSLPISVNDGLNNGRSIQHRVSLDSALTNTKHATLSSMVNVREFDFDQSQMDMSGVSQRIRMSQAKTADFYKQFAQNDERVIQQIISELSQQIDSLKKEKIDIECDRDQLKMELETTNTELQMAKSKNNQNQAKSEYYQLLTKYETLEEVNSELKYEIKLLNESIEQTKKDIASTLNQQTQTNDEITHAQDTEKINELNLKVEKLRSKVLAYEAILEKLKRRGININIKTGQISDTSENKETLLKAELAELAEKVENARETFDEISDMKIKLLSEIESKTKEYQELQEKNKSLEGVLAEKKVSLLCTQEENDVRESVTGEYTVGHVDKRMKYLAKGFQLVWFTFYGAIIARGIYTRKMETSARLVKSQF